MNSRQPLTLLWLRPTLESVLEGYFIKEVLLAEIGRPIRTVVIEASASIPFLNDVLVVSLGANLAGYLQEARAKGFRNIGLLHMADELGDHDRSFYAHADYVLRNYWFKDAIVPPNPQSLGVLWIPNGYRTGVGPISTQTMLSTVDRKIMGFFSGVLQGRSRLEERQQMAQAVTSAKLPFLVGGTPGFGQGLGPVAYAAYLCMSRFALVPGGNSPETIRLYDALEAGAIPIMLRSAFVGAPDALNNPPFLLLDSWSELPAAYAPFADANSPQVISTIEAKRQDVMAWWQSFKASHQQRLKELIDRSFARASEAR
ncbi:MAG: glycosyltransferase family 47 protein [Xanthobacteraceae bacterium]|nr:glycosyltransferase family 47 protein [Xanthobacteraceae bacterium]